MYYTLEDLYFVLFKSISVVLNGPNIWVVTVGIRARFSLKNLSSGVNTFEARS